MPGLGQEQTRGGPARSDLRLPRIFAIRISQPAVIPLPPQSPGTPAPLFVRAAPIPATAMPCGGFLTSRSGE